MTYSDKKQLEFILDLTASTYSNYSSMEICFPLTFTKKFNTALQMDTQIMTVNNFFGHWFTDIDIKPYPDNMRILPTNNSVDIYQYSNAKMKYLPEKSVKKLLKTISIQINQFTERKMLIKDHIITMLTQNERPKFNLSSSAT